MFIIELIVRIFCYESFIWRMKFGVQVISISWLYDGGLFYYLISVSSSPFDFFNSFFVIVLLFRYRVTIFYIVFYFSIVEALLIEPVFWLLTNIYHHFFSYYWRVRSLANCLPYHINHYSRYDNLLNSFQIFIAKM